MTDLLHRLCWYPPAETRVPIQSILSSLFSREGDFKTALCQYLGVEQCILGSSGRALLTSLLTALWDRDGRIRDEILIPGYTCYSVAASVVKAGLKINVYDVDPKTLDPDLDDLRSKVGPNTLAVICQHLFGIPSDIKELIRWAKENNSYVIEDAAQVLGGRLSGVPLGTIANFGFYSFGRGKPLPLGTGGALVGRNLGILPSIEAPRHNNGKLNLVETALTQVLSSPYLYWLPEGLPLGLGDTVFDPNFSISSMPVLVQNLGEKMLNSLKILNRHRRFVGSVYRQMLPQHVLVGENTGSIPAYTRFPLLAGRQALDKSLLRLGVRRMYPRAIADEPKIRPYLKDGSVHTPGAFEIAEKLITLPTHTRITDSLAQKIALKVKNHFASTI